MPNRISLQSLSIIFGAIVWLPALSLAQAQHDRVITHHGKKFVDPGIGKDTLLVMDPITGDSILQWEFEGTGPTLVNRKKVYRSNEVTTAPAYVTNNKETFEENLLAKLHDDLSILPDGTYRLDLGQVVVDKRGRIIYHKFHGIKKNTKSGWSGEIFERYVTADTTAPIAARINELLTKAKPMVPAKLERKKVIALYETFFPLVLIVVKDHMVTLDAKDYLLSASRKVTLY